MTCFKTVYLIHDIDVLRTAFNDENSVKKSIDVLNRQDVIIAHNEKMIAELKRRGCSVPLVDLGMFDYYTECKLCKHDDSDAICFAGNLDPHKTNFLYKLDEANIPIKVNVYGKKQIEFKALNYCGCFEPESLPKILKGKYGLIWEGDDFTYDASRNPYIMYNNPHKASLYIVSGLPLIIWEKAALADYILKEGIGITIKTIEDIPEKISSISKEEYEQMLSNICSVREKIIRGEHIHNAIATAESLLV